MKDLPEFRTRPREDVLTYIAEILTNRYQASRLCES
jgi:hypothetical protein